MRKYSSGIMVAVFLVMFFLRTISVCASEVQNSDLQENVDATFNIVLSPTEGFSDEVQLLLVSKNGAYEYDISLNESNSYTASVEVYGNTTYQLFYYYDSYESYEIEGLQEEFVCENGSLWNLNYNVIERISPVEKNLFPLGGDMTEEEVTALESSRFESSVFPNMSDEDVVSWYYAEVQRIVEEKSSHREDAFAPIINGIYNETTKTYFRGNSGTDAEWDAISDEKLIAFYYACVLPNIIIENNDFDFYGYIENINILESLCTSIECEELYDITYKLWEYIWEYQRAERQIPNFATYLMTEFRAEKLLAGESDVVDQTNTQEEENIGFRYVIIKYVKEHWASILGAIFGGAVLGVFYYKNKNEGKGKVKR